MVRSWMRRNTSFTWTNSAQAHREIFSSCTDSWQVLFIHLKPFVTCICWPFSNTKIQVTYYSELYVISTCFRDQLSIVCPIVNGGSEIMRLICWMIWEINTKTKNLFQSSCVSQRIVYWQHDLARGEMDWAIAAHSWSPDSRKSLLTFPYELIWYW